MTATILVVEDEVLVGMDLVMMLEDWGYRADGPHGTVERALSAVERVDPDIAILDINLGNGRTSLPVAEALQARGTPFVFLTGYSRLDLSDIPVAAQAPRLGKPLMERDLKRLLAGIWQEKREGETRG